MVYLWVIAGIMVYLIGGGITYAVAVSRCDYSGDAAGFAVTWPMSVPLWGVYKSTWLTMMKVAESCARFGGWWSARRLEAKRNAASAETAKPREAGAYRSRPCPTCGQKVEL